MEPLEGFVFLMLGFKWALSFVPPYITDGEQTPCQISQRFKDAIIVTLTDGTSPLPGLSVENLRRILLHNKVSKVK